MRRARGSRAGVTELEPIGLGPWHQNDGDEQMPTTGNIAGSLVNAFVAQFWRDGNL